MDREALKRELTDQFHQSLDQAMDAVQRAPDGSWISASEWEVREVFQKLTAGGEVRLKRRDFWSSGTGGVCPADALAGVEQSRVTPGARQLCCLMAIGQDFAQSSRDLLRVGGLSVSTERLRQITESEGKQVRKVRDRGELPAAWSADQAKRPDGRSRIYGGVDGVMAPTVTQVEKDKRRRQQITRRQQRGKAGVGNSKELPSPKPGTDERFKEMKIGIFYDQDKRHRHAFATEKPSKDFAPLLAAYAKQIGFERADQTICLFDGAVWIYRQVCAALLCLQAIRHYGLAGGDRGAGEEGPCAGKEAKPPGFAELRRGPSRDAQLCPRTGRRMGYWLRSDRSDLQNADAANQATGNEMGPRQRRGHDEPAGPARKRPMGFLLEGPNSSRGLNPQKMATPTATGCGHPLWPHAAARCAQ
jgi:hypothetical protein